MPKPFDQLRKEAEELYRSIGSVRCPYLGTDVRFNRQGLEHLKFKSGRHARSRSDQRVRLQLLRLAPAVLEASHTVQGLRDTKSFVRRRRNSRWEKVLTPVTYYEFVAVLDSVRVRVIVRKLQGGEPHFWSIIPFWKQSGNERLVHSGRPETD